MTPHRMRRLLAASAVLALFSLAPSPARAALVTFDFTGTLTFDTTGTFNTTQTLSGAFAYDTAATAISSSSTDATYPLQALSFSIDGYSGGLGGSIDRVRVVNNLGFVDAFNMFSSPPSGGPVGGFSPLSFVINFLDNSQSVFSGTGLPSNLNLSSFDIIEWTLVLGFRELAVGPITSLTLRTETEPAPIPEPGTLLLIGSGLVGVGVNVHRRNRKNS